MMGLLMGCSGVVGSGRPATEMRPIEAFRTLRVESGVRVVVTKGAQSLTLMASDDYLLPRIETVVEGHALVLRLLPGTTLRTRPIGEFVWPVVATVSTDVLEGVTAGRGTEVTGPVSAVATFPVDASGAQLNLTGLMSSLVPVTASGGSSVTLTGTGTELRATAGGGSTVLARDLVATKVTLELSGGSEARVSASSEVTGTASGGSTVVVSGNPPAVTVQVSGGSTVTRAN